MTHEENEIFMTEAKNANVLDSVCSKTVAGKGWKFIYIASSNTKEIKTYPSKATYIIFGSGQRLVSNEVMEICCVISGLPRTIIANIVNTDILLLLSKPDMKKMGFKLNMANDTLEVNVMSIELDATDSGHYYIPLKELEIKVEKVNI